MHHRVSVLHTPQSGHDASRVAKKITFGDDDDDDVLSDSASIESTPATPEKGSDELLFDIKESLPSTPLTKVGIDDAAGTEQKIIQGTETFTNGDLLVISRVMSVINTIERDPARLAKKDVITKRFGAISDLYAKIVDNKYQDTKFEDVYRSALGGSTFDFKRIAKKIVVGAPLTVASGMLGNYSHTTKQVGSFGWRTIKNVYKKFQEKSFGKNFVDQTDLNIFTLVEQYNGIQRGFPVYSHNLLTSSISLFHLLSAVQYIVPESDYVIDPEATPIKKIGYIARAYKAYMDGGEVRIDVLRFVRDVWNLMTAMYNEYGINTGMKSTTAEIFDGMVSSVYGVDLSHNIDATGFSDNVYLQLIQLMGDHAEKAEYQTDGVQNPLRIKDKQVYLDIFKVLKHHSEIWYNNPKIATTQILKDLHPDLEIKSPESRFEDLMVLYDGSDSFQGFEDTVAEGIAGGGGGRGSSGVGRAGIVAGLCFVVLSSFLGRP
nr:hypothetical protein TetV2_00582 [Oceanusvirus sp.]